MAKNILAPFQVIGGHIADTTDVSTILEQKVVNVLTTSSLERTGLPEYGAGVHSLLFEPLDDLLAVDFKTDASESLSDNISGLSLVDLQVNQTDETTAEITVYYKTPLSSIGSTTFTITLPGTLTEESPI